jgi:hypothetical protein
MGMFRRLFCKHNRLSICVERGSDGYTKSIVCDGCHHVIVSNILFEKVKKQYEYEKYANCMQPGIKKDKLYITVC